MGSMNTPELDRRHVEHQSRGAGTSESRHGPRDGACDPNYAAAMAEKMAARDRQVASFNGRDVVSTQASALDELLKRMMTVSDRLGALSDRVFGPRPTGNAGAAVEATDMASTIRDLLNVADVLVDQVERLEGIA